MKNLENLSKFEIHQTNAIQGGNDPLFSYYVPGTNIRVDVYGSNLLPGHGWVKTSIGGEELMTSYF